VSPGLSPGPGKAEGEFAPPPPPPPLDEVLSTDYALDCILDTLDAYLVRGGFLFLIMFGVILIDPSVGYSPSFYKVSSTSSCYARTGPP